MRITRNPTHYIDKLLHKLVLLNEIYFGPFGIELKQFFVLCIVICIVHLDDMECDVNKCTNVNNCCQTEEISTQNTCCQTDLDVETIKRNDNCMQVIIEELTLAKSQLLASQLSKKSFENNDELTKFYTGLPKFEVLNHVFNLVHPHVKTTSQNALNQFHEFILVLIRLKLNPPLQDLAFRFNISVSTAS